MKVEVILDEEQLKEEIGFLKRTSSTKRRLASLRADRGLQPSPAKTRRPYEHSSRKITLLMDWARAVCDFYSLKVSLTFLFSARGPRKTLMFGFEMVIFVMAGMHWYFVRLLCFVFDVLLKRYSVVAFGAVSLVVVSPVTLFDFK